MSDYDWIREIRVRIQDSIDYYADEFPSDEYPDVWKSPIGRCNGVTPLDLANILQLLPESAEKSESLNTLLGAKT